MLKVGVIGYGYWGPNIVRNFAAIDGVQVAAICDANKKAVERAGKLYPYARLSTDSRSVTMASDIDAVAIVTPVSTHFAFAKEALENGKHIFVEKPFTATTKQAEALVELAAKRKLKIMVDHTFIFTGSVTKIKKLMDAKALGDLYYFDSTRVALGLLQHDVNVIWDLAPHDFSVMDFLVKEKPRALVAQGSDHFGRGFVDIAFVTVYLANNMIAHFNVNWLSPIKVRSVMIGGSNKMLVWNELEADEKIKIYDKGIQVGSGEGLRKLLVEYRSGDMWAPRVAHTEALRLELAHFIDAVQNGRELMNDGHAGLRVVKMLEAADRSLKNGGRPVDL